MSEPLLPILENPEVLARTSAATRRVLEERAAAPCAEHFLSAELYAMLQSLVAAILPQDSVGTDVDIAAGIDTRLREGKSAGWRFAELPPDGEAYAKGLAVFHSMLQHTPMGSFDRMPPPAREGYLRCVANGDVDGPAQFPLSKWLRMLRTDVVRVWMAHPSTMLKMEYYGFADGATGQTDGPTTSEGWSALTANKALPFEQGIVIPASPSVQEA